MNKIQMLRKGRSVTPCGAQFYEREKRIISQITDECFNKEDRYMGIIGQWPYIQESKLLGIKDQK